MFLLSIKFVSTEKLFVLIVYVKHDNLDLKLLISVNSVGELGDDVVEKMEAAASLTLWFSSVSMKRSGSEN